MILVLIDHDRGELDQLSLRALTAARKLGQDIEAVVIGKEGAALAGIVGEYGAKVLHVANHANLTDYTPMASGRALKDLVEKLKPAAVLAAGSPRGNEQLAHLAAFLDLPMAAECSEITLGSPHHVLRARWAGNLIESANVHSDLLIASVLAFSTEPESVNGGAATVAEFEPALEPQDYAVKVLSRDAGESKGGVTLVDAKVIVSGGRGVGGPDGFGQIEELANLLGGTVGCSRVVTSSGWRPHAEQVGQTGTKVAPDLYIAAGISGAMQHIAGMKNSKTIVVINTDPEAPILSYADYAIIGDLHQVIPALTSAIREAKG
ncbi:MAG: electron transfer flavoprotein subunit alpha/FixB family protein [Actinobacteria bacterium]|jgi:electron transfer flavoprotein alpha subunit|nr:electron transfer flavoprotein subunit alpha/FixB family protein [Actinomycetota bacterium]NCV42229.1 electron transfer flavoprotein subunit alpha/FixB family protein [Actinomycetota bacterium]NCV81804.1 electron transfer flavoprotein subunit alpha/FixB family protein [Actinomycetota bacterium]NCW42716.1 electron transfer flavoprotein subunit alpha/FixB family protein [Actinomycetota bacterium]NCW71935.1 electron transfer flavoprotein subunit alpha/FixB family protein [Actinomycetota bacteri